MKNKSATIKAAWIGGISLIIATVISGLFTLFDNKSDNKININQETITNDSSIVAVTNIQNDMDGDFVQGKKKETESNNKPKVNIQDSNLDKSPIIVDSPGTIIGDNNVINRLDIPKPQFVYKEIYRNKLIENYETYGDNTIYRNVYETKLQLTIESKTGLNLIRLISSNKTVLDIVVLMYGVTEWRSGTGTYKNEEIRYFKITNPVGPYEVTIITDEPIDSNIEPQIIYK